MKIIDNFLSEDEFLNLKNKVVESGNFPWFYSQVLNEDRTCDNLDNYQLCHMVYNNNFLNSEQGAELIYPFFPALEIVSLVRFKLNFNPRTEKIVEHGMHSDCSFKCLTAVYYLNTNNGYTKFESEEKVKSVENRIVIFNSSKKHTGSTCTDQRGRYVININFFSEKFSL